MKKFLRNLLVRLLRVTVNEAKDIAIEELRKKWPAIGDLSEFIIDGKGYYLQGQRDGLTILRQKNIEKRIEMTLNTSDLRYDEQNKHWYLEGRR